MVVCGVQLEQRAAGGRPHTTRKIDDVINLYLCEVNYLMVSKDMTYTTHRVHTLGHLVFL